MANKYLENNKRAVATTLRAIRIPKALWNIDAVFYTPAIQRVAGGGGEDAFGCEEAETLAKFLFELFCERVLKGVHSMEGGSERTRVLRPRRGRKVQLSKDLNCVLRSVSIPRSMGFLHSWFLRGGFFFPGSFPSLSSLD